jgi:hypothetical protein
MEILKNIKEWLTGVVVTKNDFRKGSGKKAMKEMEGWMSKRKKKCFLSACR